MRGALLAVTALLAAVAGGCAERAGPQPPVPTTLALTVGLSDIPAGADWILLRVTAPANATFTLEVSDAFPLDAPLRHCSIEATAGNHVAFLGRPPRLTVASSRLQRDPVVDQGVPSGQRLTVHGGTDFPAPAGTSLLLVGYRDAARWRDAGAAYQVTLRSDKPVAWAPAANGTLECATDLTQFPQGDLTVTPAATTAQGMVAPFRIEHAGLALAFAESDLGFQLRVAGPNGTLYDHTEPASGIGASPFLPALPAGQYSVEVPSLRGQAVANAGFLAVDLPAWVGTQFGPAQPPTSG